MFTILAKGWHALRVGFVPALFLLTTFQFTGRPPDKPSPLEFRVHLTAQAAEGIADLGLEVPVNGRVFVIVSRDGDIEPREQIDVTGVPFWGKDVVEYAAGDRVSLEDRDDAVLGFPLESLAELPPGDYYVQAFLNVYTTFHRADGHIVQMHLNAGEGQYLWESPGNAYSQVQQINLDPGRGGKVDLELTEVIPPIEPLLPGEVLQQGNPRDTDWVKYIKIKSDLLTEFWGHDMYIGANILLPKGYDENPENFYPVIYQQGHFPGSRAPFGFREGNAFYNFWISEDAPRFIAVVFRDANPYYDTSYSVNSANLGPYGDAIMNELIPAIEEKFRIQATPWTRILAGGSTGGWEALAMKVWNPGFFGGTWAWCPDSVDFHYHQIVDIYDDDNAYFTFYDWNKVERPSARRSDGNILFTIRQENLWELAQGPDDRSGGQWDIWEAVYSPVGSDGYPVPVWDPVSGAIDHQVAQSWQQNYDLTYYIQQNWSTVAPEINGQLTVTTGMMDTYYLNESTYLLKEFLDQATDPTADVKFDFGFRKPHCWLGESPNNPGEQMTYPEFIQIASDWIADHYP